MEVQQIPQSTRQHFRIRLWESAVMSVPVAVVGIAASLVFVIPAIEAKIELAAESRVLISENAEINRIEANDRFNRIEDQIAVKMSEIAIELANLRQITTRLAAILEERSEPSHSFGGDDAQLLAEP